MKEEEEQREERAKARPREEKKEPRVSTTDPEARVMRMADGGYRPAYAFVDSVLCWAVERASK